MTHKQPTRISVISKVTPIQVTPIKPISTNTTLKVINQFKHIIFVELFVGISRMQLLNYSSILQFTHFIYSAILIAITIILSLDDDSTSASLFVLKITDTLKYITLLVLALATNRKSLKKFFEDLTSFDYKLNISDDLDITCPVRRGWYWVLANICYSILELIIMAVFLFQQISADFLFTYIIVLAHDFEHVFFCTMIRMILIRAIVIKGHVIKTFSQRDAKTKLSEAEALSNKAKLDISSLHRNYELLHKCAEQLNSIMSLPMLLMLFCSGLSTTLLLKKIFSTIQTIDGDEMVARTAFVYSASRCLKYTVMVIVPCYLSSVTTTQVSLMRTILHDAMNSTQISKMDRRRVKAFFQLTRENEFAYALWGVIRLNMSLPLSYLSLCTTYLVIIIQFSKFID